MLVQQVFLSKWLSLLLLAATIVALVVFAVKWVRESQMHARKVSNKATSSAWSLVGKTAQNIILGGLRLLTCRFRVVGLGTQHGLNPDFVAYTIFVSNFIGIVFVRT